ncbi:MAG: 50S ribosomal protein L11 methyltransferase [Muribaculaceae bacterium]|nr:50S ribosomal protein L11 methyltransferase [Muribaculaceae bacterium]
MNDYIEVRFSISPYEEAYADVLSAILADSGFESFVTGPDGLTAYVSQRLYDRDTIDTAILNFPIDGVTITHRDILVEGRDWNAEWEKNYFKPIVIGNRCVVHSSFHSDVPVAEYDIVIDPKMAFGTGHHQTTTLMIEALLSFPLDGKAVIDMGTGTGILAILAAMRGASPVTGIEIDEAAYVNALENIRLNRQPQINIVLGDAARLADVEPADVFIANINRNIILADIEAYAARLKSHGTMLLSGFYESDVEILLNAAKPLGLSYISHDKKDDWTCLRLQKA